MPSAREILFGLSNRLPVKAKTRKKVESRVKSDYGRLVCERCGRKPRGVKLRKHHVNMNARISNSPSNIQLLCPNCHDIIHRTYKRVTYKNQITGNAYYNRVVKRKPKKKTERRRTNNMLDISVPKIDFNF